MRKRDQNHESRLHSLRSTHESEKHALISSHDSELRAVRAGPSSVSVGASCTTLTAQSDEVSHLAGLNRQLEGEVKSFKLSNATLKRRLQEQEREKECLTRTAESSQTAHQAIMVDHESLQTYHQQLSADYEGLAKDVARLKSENKRMFGDLEDARKRV